MTPEERALAALVEAGVPHRVVRHGPVRSLAEDEVLRAFDNLIKAALRTNFYQRPDRPVISVKVDSPWSRLS